jgi:hypothetical protein
MRSTRKFKNLVAIGAILLFVSGTTTSAYSDETENRNFSIMVNEAPNLCETFDMNYPSGNAVTWEVDQDVLLTDISDPTNTSLSLLTVEIGATVEMSLDLNWQNGSSCDPADGSESTLYPTGTVSATWTLSGFNEPDPEFQACTVDSPCQASSTSFVFTQMSAPLNDTGPFSGSVAVSWVP